jgi:hypothetical protein
LSFIEEYGVSDFHRWVWLFVLVCWVSLRWKDMNFFSDSFLCFLRWWFFCPLLY